ncbi:MAG: leucyl aminopeptidase, partial [Alphaproteobacteria bacterium]|nr:leucyl aminopeptidase [Alphaproteobacteria bacterium]
MGLDSAQLVAVCAAEKFDGDAGSLAQLYVTRDGRTYRLLLLGTGSGSVADCEKAGAALAARLLTCEGHALLDVRTTRLDDNAICHILAGASLRAWRFDKYRTTIPERQKARLETISVLGAPASIAHPWAETAAVLEGVALTRSLVTEPSNVIYPESFVERAQALKALGVELTVLTRDDMSKLGMGALLGVAQGSVRPPRLLVMRWDGTKGAQAKPVALVGKGVTFDTGGISLKAPTGMEDMKYDMAGAGAVIGTIKALAGRKAKAHVVGVCGLVENMPDGN